MKNLRLVTFLVFAVCAFCLPAQAQKKWTYKAQNKFYDEITIIITQRPKGFEVSGEMSYNYYSASQCSIRGSYFPATGRLKATAVCRDLNGVKEEIAINGFKRGKDALEITEPAHWIARLEGGKSTTTGPSTESSSTNSEGKKSSNGCVGFAGKWLTTIDNAVIVLNAGGSGSYFWRNQNNTISGRVSGNVLEGEYHQQWHSNENLKSGRVKFTLAADGNSFTGNWWYRDGTSGGSWNGTCQSGN